MNYDGRFKLKDYFKNFPKTENMKQFFDQSVETHFTFMKSIPKPNPLWLSMLKDGGLNIYCIINDVKESPMQKIKTLIEQENPDAYVFFGLGWSKTVIGGRAGLEKFLDNHEYGTIKNMPDKKEVLTVIGRSRDGQTEIQKLFFIKRNSKNMITDFEEDKGERLEANLP